MEIVIPYMDWLERERKRIGERFVGTSIEKTQDKYGRPLYYLLQGKDRYYDREALLKEYYGLVKQARKLKYILWPKK